MPRDDSHFGRSSLQSANKTIVVIGDTTGLELSVARAFVREGARGGGGGRNPDSGQKVEAELGANARALAGDASHPDTAPRAIEAALNEFGGFDGLYHVAGGSGRCMGDGPLHKVMDTDISATLALNLTSLILSNRAATLQFLKQKTGGSILNMGLVLGQDPSP